MCSCDRELVIGNLRGSARLRHAYRKPGVREGCVLTRQRMLNGELSCRERWGTLEAAGEPRSQLIWASRWRCPMSRQSRHFTDELWASISDARAALWPAVLSEIVARSEGGRRGRLRGHPHPVETALAGSALMDSRDQERDASTAFAGNIHWRVSKLATIELFGSAEGTLGAEHTSFARPSSRWSLPCGNRVTGNHATRRCFSAS